MCHHSANCLPLGCTACDREPAYTRHGGVTRCSVCVYFAILQSWHAINQGAMDDDFILLSQEEAQQRREANIRLLRANQYASACCGCTGLHTYTRQAMHPTQARDARPCRCRRRVATAVSLPAPRCPAGGHLAAAAPRAAGSPPLCPLGQRQARPRVCAQIHTTQLWVQRGAPPTTPRGVVG